MTTPSAAVLQGQNLEEIRMSQPSVSRRALNPKRWTAAWLCAVSLLGLACAPVPAGGQGQNQAKEASAKRKPANVMGFEGAAWLEREGRDKEEKPEVVLAAMELKEGQTVAEIGAGTGYFSRRIGKVVGPTGKVLAVDIQAPMLDLLKQYAAKEGVKNISTILGTETDPKLPPHGVDRILMVDVYHEFQQPEPMLAHIRESLAPGGTVTLVEYRAEDNSASHILKEHRMTAEQVLSEWNAAGFELANQIETLPSQHIFIFSTRRGARVR
jgi:ubiquinone/menaquinone biosynthesis C-methylase UbiE